MGLTLRLIGLHVLYTVCSEYVAGIGQQVTAVKQAMGHKRQEGIEFQCACCAGLGQGHVVAEHHHGCLCHGLRNHGIDLARHDGRTALPGWQVYLLKTGLWAGAEHAQVRTDLDECHRMGLDNAGHFSKHVCILCGLDQILCTCEIQAGQFAEFVHHTKDELSLRAQARANGCAAQVHHPQTFHTFVDAPPIPIQRFRIGAHFTAQCGEHRVLKLGTPHLDHMGKRLFPVLEGLLQRKHCLLQRRDPANPCHAQGGWEGIVRGLMQIHVIHRGNHRVIAGLFAQDLQGPVGQHLVDIHVEACASPALQRIHEDAVAKQTLAHLPACLKDGFGLVRRVRPHTQVLVHHGTGQFDIAVRQNHGPMHWLAGHRKILHSSGRVYAMQCPCGDFQAADQVCFSSRRTHGGVF